MAAPSIKAYLTEQYIAPFLNLGSRLGKIALSLADQLAVKAPVSVVLLAGSGIGYTANVAAKIVEKFNVKARSIAEYALSEEAAQAAADTVSDVKSAATAFGVGVLAANQLGILPLSAILAAILFYLKINLGTGTGRAYVVSSFYAWYIAQPAATQTAINASATEYAAKGAAAAKTLAPLLAKAAVSGAVAGKNAFGAVASALRKRGTGAPKAAETEVPSSAAAGSGGNAPEAEAALTAARDSGAVAAAVTAAESEGGQTQAINGAAAAEAVVAGSAAAGVASSSSSVVVEPPPAQTAAPAARARGNRAKGVAASGVAAPGGLVAPLDGRGRRKTKKRAPKRRVTRRRKAPKILGTPVFVY